LSVIVTLWLQGDPDKLEQIAANDPERVRSIAEEAKQHGVIAHRFYGTDGQVLVVDEWPDEQSFQSFFQENQSRIGPMMEAAGASQAPQPRFWHKLDTHDEYGWGA
jgi:hypothetical protein